MVFRRFHRTAGPLLVLAFMGIVAALVVPRMKSERTERLQFLNGSRDAGKTTAFFLAPDESPNSKVFNLTSSQSRLQLIFRDAAGLFYTNDSPNQSFDYLPNGKRRLSVGVPDNAVEFRLNYFSRLQKGRALMGAGGSPPRTLFVLPWATAITYRSESMRVVEVIAPAIGEE